MNTEPLDTPAAEAKGFDLVTATESGAFFTGALSMVLRLGAMLGFLPALAALEAAGQVPSGRSSLPLLIVALTCGLAGWLGLKVMFARARRIANLTESRFPIASVVGESVRAVAEVVFVWSMTVGPVGVMAMVWQEGRVSVDSTWAGLASACGIAIAGGAVLLCAHLMTEINTAITHIANNTPGNAQNQSA